MKYRKTLLLTVFITPLFSGCGADSHTVQSGNSKYQLSAQKGKDKMPTQSPMLNEILATANGIPPWEYHDVGGIVSNYIPIGTSKERAKIILAEMNQKYDEEENIIYAGYVGNMPPLVPNPRIFIKLEFNHSGYLELITARYTYAQ